MDEWQSASTNNVVLIIVIILVAIGIIAIIIAVAASSSDNSTNSNASNAQDGADGEDDDEEDDIFGGAVPGPTNGNLNGNLNGNVGGNLNGNLNGNVNGNLNSQPCLGKCSSGINPAVLANLTVANSVKPVNNGKLFDDHSPIPGLQSNGSPRSVVEDLDISDGSGELVDIEELARMEDLASVEEFNMPYSGDGSPYSPYQTQRSNRPNYQPSSAHNSSLNSPIHSAPSSPHGSSHGSSTDSSLGLETDNSEKTECSEKGAKSEKGAYSEKGANPDSFTFTASSDASEVSPVKPPPVILPQIPKSGPTMVLGKIAVPRPIIPVSSTAPPQIPKYNETFGASVDDTLSNPGTFSSDFSSMTDKSDRPSIPVPSANRRQPVKQVPPPLLTAADLYIKSKPVPKKGPPFNNPLFGAPPRMGPF